MGGLIFVGVRSVLQLKTRNGNGDENLITMESTGDVVGLPGLPAYPGSTFLFEDQIREETVQRFLSEGQSAYMIPDSSTWEDVVAYYNDELPSRGWEHLQSVELNDELRLHGEYWIFSSDVSEAEDVAEEENEGEQPELVQFGLRIYSKINAVWYEKITVAQAQSGLADEVAREKEIELLLAMGSMQELPKSFPWELSYPEIWDAEVRESRLIEAPLVEFFAIESEGIVTIEPIAFDAGKDLKVVGEEFLEEVNSRRGEEDAFSVLTTEELTIAKQEASKFNLDGGETDGWMAVVVHPGNGIVYAITSFGGEEAFFNYVLENLSLKS